MLSTQGRWGVKIGLNLVHVVVEWPLTWDLMIPLKPCSLPRNFFRDLTWCSLVLSWQSHFYQRVWVGDKPKDISVLAIHLKINKIVNIYLSKGWVISEGIVNLVPSSKKTNQITVPQLFTFDWKVKSQWFGRYIEDGTKLKIPSKITTPLIYGMSVINTVAKQFMYIKLTSNPWCVPYPFKYGRPNTIWYSIAQSFGGHWLFFWHFGNNKKNLKKATLFSNTAS
jgi:hypothetical protein